MKIKGLGPASLEQLGFDSISDIYNADKSFFEKVLGGTRGPKVFEAVELSKSADFATFIEALSIPSISAGSARKLAEVANSLDEITKEAAAAAGLGNVATSNLISWMGANMLEIRSLPVSFSKRAQTTANTTESKTVCITGKLKDYKNRADAASALVDAGYVVVDSVTKATHYLVNESGDVSTKTKKAEQYKIPTVSMKELLGEN
jgi:NAD-dependent DNA ligase